jgi:hypothetical protein
MSSDGAGVPWKELTSISEGPNRVGVTPHLSVETDPVSKMLCFLVSRILDNG